MRIWLAILWALHLWGEKMIPRMHCFPILVAAFLLTSLAVALPKTKTETQTKWPTYIGAWFTIEYPPGFKVRPGMESPAAELGNDSAFFLSSDRTVEFYVFSPQWYGEPTDILLDPKTETLISSKAEVQWAEAPWSESSSEIDRVVSKTTWQTIRAKDNSYTRSYVNIIHGPSARGDLIGQKTFGIKYANRRVHNRYKRDYLRFKRSLEQYAD